MVSAGEEIENKSGLIKAAKNFDETDRGKKTITTGPRGCRAFCLKKHRREYYQRTAPRI